MTKATPKLFVGDQSAGLDVPQTFLDRRDVLGRQRLIVFRRLGQPAPELIIVDVPPGDQLLDRGQLLLGQLVDQAVEPVTSPR